jgi:hypothetical protein
MAKIVKLTKDNVQVYPQTITEAVADIETSMTLADWMKQTTTTIDNLANSESGDVTTINTNIQQLREELNELKLMLGIGTENTEGIDNLSELLTFFNGIRDSETFKGVMDSLRVEIEGSALTADSNEGEYADFDTILSWQTTN